MKQRPGFRLAAKERYGKPLFLRDRQRPAGHHRAYSGKIVPKVAIASRKTQGVSLG
jgi:hypothetical protein